MSDQTDGPTKAAIIYVRVSTKEQAQAGGDAEGYSIPAQRQACQRKAASLNSTVIEEYVDAGESAKTAARPALRQMLERLEQGGVDYLIVHKVDRLARNRADDVTIGLAIRAAGAQLVSCTENIDETPSGKLLHGIMASIAEFYSANLANEILKGSVQKAESGGTPTMAPLGYLNIQRFDGGRDVRSIELDPVRAPLVRFAFETYASGNWSLHQLAEELGERGLRTRGGPKSPEKPVTPSALQRVLRNSYYTGIVTYRGIQYEGKHEPLVSFELWDEVQRTLDAHYRAGEKRRIHHHYLKGTIWCARCHSRLTIGVVTGNGGRYSYYFCLGRQTKRTGCDLPYLPVDEVEAIVEAHWRKEQLPAEVLAKACQAIIAELEELRLAGGKTRLQLQQRISSLTNERMAYAEKSASGVIPDDIARTKQNDLTKQLLRAQAELAKHDIAVAEVDDDLREAFDLAGDCSQAYQQADDNLRRDWNQAWFEWLRLDVDRVTEVQRTPPMRAIRDGVRLYRREDDAVRAPERQEAPSGDLLAEPATGIAVVAGSRMGVATLRRVESARNHWVL